MNERTVEPNQPTLTSTESAIVHIQPCRLLVVLGRLITHLRLMCVLNLG